MSEISLIENTELRKQFIEENFCLVFTGKLTRLELANYMGWSSVDSMKKFVQRHNLNRGTKAKGKKLLKDITDANLTVSAYLRGRAQALGAELAEKKLTETISKGSPIAAAMAFKIETAGDKTWVKTTLKNRIIQLDLEEHNRISQEYSSKWGQGLPSIEVANRHDMSLSEFLEYIKIHGITRNSLPVSKSVLADENITEDDKLTLADKSYKLEQKIEKALLKAREEDALKWQAFLQGKLKLDMAIADYVPPAKTSYMTYKDINKTEVRKLVVNMSDWQIGSLAQGAELISGEDWNTEKAVKAISEYASNIGKHIASSRCFYDEVILCNIGDLGHGVQGLTASGTELEVDTYRSVQVKAIFDCIIALIEACRKIAPKVSIYSVDDNHLGYMNEMIMDQVNAWYGGANPVKDVAVKRNSKALEYFTVGDDILVVLYHGATGRPGRGDLGKDAARERNGYYLVMDAVRKFPKHKNIHIITGHVHHRVQEEFSHFTVHTLGCLPRGDMFSDTLLLNCSKASQSIFEINPQSGLIYDIPIPIKPI